MDEAGLENPFLVRGQQMVDNAVAEIGREHLARLGTAGDEADRAPRPVGVRALHRSGEGLRTSSKSARAAAAGGSWDGISYRKASRISRGMPPWRARLRGHPAARRHLSATLQYYQIGIALVVRPKYTCRMRVTRKGQVTVPKDLRERLGITSETEVEFREERGKLVLLKKNTRSAIAKLRGKIKRLPVGKDVDDYLRLTRGDR